MLPAILSNSANQFFKRLTKKDARLIRNAQRIFLSNVFLNLILYYQGCGVDGNNTKFPATISYTIRGGLPLYTNLLVWTAGWRQMMRVWFSKGDQMARTFAVQMYLVGFSTVYLFPVGQGGWRDQVHGALAGLYFIYHGVMFKYLRTTTPFQIGFYVSFFTFLVKLRQIRKLEVQYEFRTETNQKKNTTKRKMPVQIQNRLWWHELTLMLTENAMFISFLLGMTSSLKQLRRNY